MSLIKNMIENKFDTPIENLVSYVTRSGDHRSVFIANKKDVKITKCSYSHYKLYGNSWDVINGAKFIELKESLNMDDNSNGINVFTNKMTCNDRFHLFEDILYFVDENIMNARTYLGI